MTKDEKAWAKERKLKTKAETVPKADPDAAAYHRSKPEGIAPILKDIVRD